MITRKMLSRIAAVGTLLLAAACSADGPRIPTDTEDPRRPGTPGQALLAPQGPAQAQHA